MKDLIQEGRKIQETFKTKISDAVVTGHEDYIVKGDPKDEYYLGGKTDNSYWGGDFVNYNLAKRVAKLLNDEMPDRTAKFVAKTSKRADGKTENWIQYSDGDVWSGSFTKKSVAKKVADMLRKYV